MRIAIDVDGHFGPEPSGIHRYLDSLLGALPDALGEHELTAFAPALHRGHRLPARAAAGAGAWASDPRVRLDVPSSAGRAGGPLGALSRPGPLEAAGRLHPGLPWRLEAATLRARTRVRTRRYDVLHVPSTHARWFADGRARRQVATIYDLTPRLHPETQRPEWVAEWERYFSFASRRCARVLTLSESARRDIVEHLGIPADRVDVTPLAPRAGTRRLVDGSERDALLASCGVADAPFVLYAGTLEPRKNLVTLVEAFALAAARHGDDRLRLVLAGGPWDDHDRMLRDAARRHGVADRVIFPGWVPDDVLNALMSACRVFAYVSIYEGFGLPPLEAMACGAPVVVSDVSSLPEVVGDAGVQVPPSDAEAIATAIARLLGDEEERDRRVRASEARATEFSWRRTAALTVRCYEAAAAA